MNKIFSMDAIEFLASLEDGVVDLIVTDPAYESLEKHRERGTTTRLTNQWFDVFPNDRFPEFFKHCYRVLKKDTHLYVMCDLETMFIIKPIAEAAGFKFWNALIWDKQRIGTGYHYRKQTEFVLFFEKGKRRLNSDSMCELLRHRKVDGGYPTEKPVGLYADLILQSTQPSELIVDPFCGSGAGGEAAIEHGRFFWGNDTSEEAIELTEERIGEAELRGQFDWYHMWDRDGKKDRYDRTACGINMKSGGKRTYKFSTRRDGATCPICLERRAGA